MYIYSRIYHQFRVTSFYLCTSLQRHHRIWERWKRKGTGSLRQTYRASHLRDWMNIVVRTCVDVLETIFVRLTFENRWRGITWDIAARIIRLVGRKIWRIFNVVPFAEYESRGSRVRIYRAGEEDSWKIDFTSCFIISSSIFPPFRSRNTIDPIFFYVPLGKL